ncbi:MAG: DivIVA domain-containing protein [Oscillospiraceae bacterium]|jgi:DivIVA domain|nr:DivIVA domain-containing protein [Oscillospiraceae bacterium]
MLTPQDLQEVSFEKAKIGGYVMKSVDEFLEPLMDDYVTLYKENAVLKSKMRLLVERLESYRANEANMKAAAEEAKKNSEAMLEEARRRGEEIVAQAAKDAKSVSQDIDSAVSAENERLRRAKELTAEFVTAVEAQLARQHQALETLKSLDLPMDRAAAKAARKAYDYEAEKDAPVPVSRPLEANPAPIDKAQDIAAQIEENVSRITGDTPRPKPEPKADPKAATKVMPALDERTTAKFANLKFGKNYQP